MAEWLKVLPEVGEYPAPWVLLLKLIQASGTCLSTDVIFFDPKHHKLRIKISSLFQVHTHDSSHMLIVMGRFLCLFYAHPDHQWAPSDFNRFKVKLLLDANGDDLAWALRWGHSHGIDGLFIDGLPFLKMGGFSMANC